MNTTILPTLAALAQTHADRAGVSLEAIYPTVLGEAYSSLWRLLELADIRGADRIGAYTVGEIDRLMEEIDRELANYE